MPESDPVDEPSSKLQFRISSHLDSLAEQVFLLEETIGKTLGSRETLDQETISNLQNLDFLRQSLEDLALLTLAMSEIDTVSLEESTLNYFCGKVKLKVTKALIGDKPFHSFGSEIDGEQDFDLF
ncbi:hypothetical protein [Roseobacter sp.]|uniref:hypothetical protein n=1 Tax=Roseobacter sp. TaxID=1907202 RepID=UPI0032983624